MGGLAEKMSAIGLLLLRLIFGGTMLVAHGWQKFSKFSEYVGEFPDPLGIGRKASLMGAVGAEFFCAALIIVGFLTRIATIPLFFTMLVAFFIVHGGDPFKAKEPALLYGAAFLILFFTGPGAYSVDKRILSRFQG